MHNYNPPNKYGQRTRMGNWSEEWDLEQAKRKEYMRRKATGTSTVSERERIFLQSHQSASLSYSSDGLRHFNDHVMLFNAKVEGFFVTDVSQRLLNTEQSYNVSAVKTIHAAARSVFVIERANPNDGFKGDVLHFGQHLRLRINPLLLDRPLHLFSEPSSVTRYSKVSRLQEVIFLLKDNFNTVWVCEHPDPNCRLQSDGLPIRVDDTVLLKHQMTNQWLGATEATYDNIFGKEFEVVVHNFLVNSKSQNLVQEKKGVSTIDVPARAQKQQNLWLIIGASTPQQQFDQSLIKNAVVNKLTLQKKLKHLLTERGIYAIRFLHRIFKCLDLNKIGVIERGDFCWGLQSGKLFLNEEQLQFLQQQYSDKTLVSYNNFLKDLRGELNIKRYDSIIDAYKRVQKVVGVRVTLEELGKMFDAKHHPEVTAGRKSEKDAFNEFVWSWDNIKPDYLIEIQEFAAYFQDISGMIPNDHHFELFLLSVLHL